MMWVPESEQFSFWCNEEKMRNCVDAFVSTLYLLCVEHFIGSFAAFWPPEHIPI